MSDPPISRRTLLTGALAVPLLAGAATAGINSAPRAFPWPRTLRAGSHGADVVELQVRVAGWAADRAEQTYVGLDGDFGPTTEAAVRRFQSAYGLAVDGVVGARTEAALSSLESADASTRHFTWSEFESNDGSGFSGGNVAESAVRENVRRTMYTLEALRRKVGDRAVTVSSGFRSVAYNRSIGGADNSLHTYGLAADTTVAGMSTISIYRVAETAGYSGLESYHHSWQHVDTRVQYPYGTRTWWWESGVV